MTKEELELEKAYKAHEELEKAYVELNNYLFEEMKVNPECTAAAILMLMNQVTSLKVRLRTMDKFLNIVALACGGL